VINNFYEQNTVQKAYTNSDLAFRDPGFCRTFAFSEKIEDIFNTFFTHIWENTEQSLSGAKLEGGMRGCDTPQVRIIWIGRANHLDRQGNQRF
jgi:hypothetical protein